MVMSSLCSKDLLLSFGRARVCALRLALTNRLRSYFARKYEGSSKDRNRCLVLDNDSFRMGIGGALQLQMRNFIFAKQRDAEQTSQPLD